MSFKLKVKALIYWCSIIAPAYDIIVGTVRAFKELIGRYADERRYIDEVNKFIDDNERKV